MLGNKKICIFGKSSFVANGLSEYWGGSYIKLLSVAENWEEVRSAIKWADIIINCAGVTRSDDETDFFKVNFHYNSSIINIINEMKYKKYVTFSSIHYTNSDIYGYSQRYKEYLANCLDKSNSSIIVRLPGVYGANAKPNSVSVVSTFFHNHLLKLESEIIGSDKVLKLIHIRKLAEELALFLAQEQVFNGHIFCPTHSEVTVGNLHAAITAVCNETSFINPALDLNLKLGLAETYNGIKELEL